MLAATTKGNTWPAVTVEDCPQAVEMFEGNVGDSCSLASQVREVKERFKLDRMVMIGALRAPAVHSPGGRRTRMCKRFLRVYRIGQTHMTRNTTITPELLDKLPAKCERPEGLTGEGGFSSRRRSNVRWEQS
jgi:hypothetical protein